MEEPDRNFTLQEAQALVAWLQQTFDAIEQARGELARSKARVQSLMTRQQPRGGGNKTARWRRVCRRRVDVIDFVA